MSNIISGDLEAHAANHTQHIRSHRRQCDEASGDTGGRPHHAMWSLLILSTGM